MKQYKYLFIDRDGTIIKEPQDEQVDSIDKLEFLPDVFTALNKLQQAGFRLIMISNQDGLDTESFPLDSFNPPQNMMLAILQSQQISFEEILICPHTANDRCDCRKPKVGLLLDYLKKQCIDRENSYVIGDRDTDLQLAENLGINGIKIHDWSTLAQQILNKPRRARVERTTKETQITIDLDLDSNTNSQIETGIQFFNHMLEQIVRHADISASIICQGDLEVDDHHSVEDTAIVFGTALKQALSDKRGIQRFGFLLPMDESEAKISLDLSGRAYYKFNAEFKAARVGDLNIEMVEHFFRSFADALQATLHIELKGQNTHHMVESAFKALGRCLKQAIQRDGIQLPTSKGVL